MALSGWFIDDIELPIAPQSDQRSITRTFQSETLFNFFPELTKSTARASDYTFKGIVYPLAKIFALDQIASSADTNTVIVIVPSIDLLVPANKFAVKQLTLERSGPLFVVDEESGLTVPAVKFAITLTQLADEGEVTEGVDGFQEGEEGGLGLVYLEELTETANEAAAEDYGPFELFMNPELGLIVAIPKVEAEI